MTPTQRRLLLGFFAVVFALACPPIILFSRGYRLDFSPLRIIRTGTLALQSHPKGGEIWVAGRNTGKKTPEAVGGLKAGRYRVEVRKEGYLPWAKTLEVFPDLQTWASQIVLLPERLILEPVVQGRVLEFTLGRDGTISAFRTAVNPAQLQAMDLADGKGGETRVLADLSFLGNPARYELEDFQWSPDSKRLLFAARLARRWSEKLGKRTYLVADIESSTTTPVPLPPAGAPAAEPTAAAETAAPATTPPPDETPVATPEGTPPTLREPEAAAPPSSPSSIGAAAWMGSKALVVFSRGSLTLVRLPDWEVTPLRLPEPVLGYAVTHGERVVFLTAQEPRLRRFAVSDSEAPSPEDLMQIEEAELGPPAGEPDEPAATLSPLPRDRFALLMRNGLLFVLDPVEKALHHVAEGVESASISSDGKKLAYATRYGLGVFYLEVTETEPRKLPGSRAAITRSESRITGFVWHRLAEHLAHASGDTVVLAELDDRDERNSPTVASSASAIWGLDYDGRRDILYLKRSRSRDPEGVFSARLTPEGTALLALP